jgi:hypothetical protein
MSTGTSATAPTASDLRRFRRNLQGEVDSASLYRAMAPLVARDHGAFDAVTTTRDRTEQPPVQPLLSRHRAIA